MEALDRAVGASLNTHEFISSACTIVIFAKGIPCWD